MDAIGGMLIKAMLAKATEMGRTDDGTRAGDAGAPAPASAPATTLLKDSAATRAGPPPQLAEARRLAERARESAPPGKAGRKAKAALVAAEAALEAAHVAGDARALDAALRAVREAAGALLGPFGAPEASKASPASLASSASSIDGEEAAGKKGKSGKKQPPSPPPKEEARPPPAHSPASRPADELPPWDPRGPDATAGLEGAERQRADALHAHSSEHYRSAAFQTPQPPPLEGCHFCALQRLQRAGQDASNFEPTKRLIAAMVKQPDGAYEELLVGMIRLLRLTPVSHHEHVARSLFYVGLPAALPHILFSRRMFVAFYAAYLAEALTPFDEGLRLLRPAAPALARLACQGLAVERMQALRALAAFARAAPDLADEILCRAGPAAAVLMGVGTERLRREAEDAVQAGRYSRHAVEIVTRATDKEVFMGRVESFAAAVRREAVAAAARIAAQAAASAAEHPAPPRAEAAGVPLPPPVPNPAGLSKEQLEALAARGVPTQDPLAVAAAGPFDAGALADAAARMALDADFDTRWHALALLRALARHPRHGVGVASQAASSGALAAAAGPLLAAGRACDGELAFATVALLRAALKAHPALEPRLARWLRADAARLEALRAWAAAPPPPAARPHAARFLSFWVDGQGWALEGPPPPASAREEGWKEGLAGGAWALLERAEAAGVEGGDALPENAPPAAGRPEPRGEHEPWPLVLSELKMRRITPYDLKYCLLMGGNMKDCPDLMRRMREKIGGLKKLFGPEIERASEYTRAADRLVAPKCGACGKPLAKEGPRPTCGRCLAASYCNQACQKADWKKHKLVCRHA